MPKLAKGQKLTKRVVDAAPIPASGESLIFDDEIPGFGLRVFPSGRKSYLIQYRSGGRTRRVSLGVHGVLTPEEARKRARELLADVSRGADPSGELASLRNAPTVASVCDRFLSDYVAHRCKPSTQAEYRRSVELFIKPKIGPFKIGDVRRPDIAELHHALRHTPYQANRTLGVLSKLFNLSEVWGLRPDGSNPCRHVPKYREERRERFLSAEEFGRLGAALDAMEQEEPNARAAVAAFRLLTLTGCRLGEIQTLRWDYIRENVIYLPDSKTGAKRVYLGKHALDVLARIERQPENPYVIAGEKPGQHLTDMQRPWRRLRKRAGLPDLRIHDLRHSFASGALALGEGLPMIGKLLGHSQVQTTARYAHLADNPIRSAADRISATIAEALAKRPKP